MSRAIVIVLDSFGLGAAPDADRFGDTGASTLGHIARWAVQQGRPLHLPNLLALGLGQAAQATSGAWPDGLPHTQPARAVYGAAAEISFGKDTPSGHWEMMGCPVPFDWGYFAPAPASAPAGQSVFPPELMAQWLAECGLEGSLCNGHGSGTEVIAQFGDEHVRTGWPICYTSADSVFQVAAHETHFGLERLLDICVKAKPIFDQARIARIIARPFKGESGAYVRTGNRRDYTTPPPGETLMDRLLAQGREVHAVGKIGDIFAHRGVSRLWKADGNAALCAATLDALDACPDGGMVFTNLVDFDMHYGHRRDVAGYADALEAFDAWLPQLQARLRPDDVLAISADHGCDPTWPGSDHTRECVPLLFSGPGIHAAHDLGRVDTFADLGQSLSHWLGVGALAHGVNRLGQ
ncbi:phosphopentomutase [Amphibiibacter pelophylacis]|uniref:Phosphopentomutase n=1 Tax=Amphibiibacter pelophylacis TaxID=1799477 RepID=A0ACC6P3K4_9BURK